MLSWSIITERIKEELSYPFQMLEKSDEQIIDYLKRNALKKFEFYYPQKWRMTLNCADPTIQVPDRRSEFYIIDPDEREIKTIVAFYPTMGSYLFNNHPIFGPWTTGQVESWHLQTFNSGLLQPFSNFSYMTEFMPPNMVRISPKYSGLATIEYERSHDPELSTINPEMHDVFIDLCLGMFMMMIGRLRQKYTNTTTPFGEITLNGDLIYNDGKEMFDKIIDKMDRGALTNVVFDHG
jgi:hypothetical protein